MRKFIAVLFSTLLIIAFAPEPAGAVQCASYSSQSRQCFFGVYKPCMDKFQRKGRCHTAANACRNCLSKQYACWKKLKSRGQCGTCSAIMNTCMKPVMKGLQ